MPNSQPTTKESTTPASVPGGTFSDDGAASRRGLRGLGFLSYGDGDFARVAILVLLVVVLGIVAPAFLSQASWIATSQYSTEVVLLALGQTFVIISGGIDLSVGAVLGCASMIAAVVMQSLLASGMNSALIVVIGVAVALAAGALMGTINGLVITRLKITPFIATLGMFGVAGGVTNLLNGGTDIVNLPTGLEDIGNTTLLGGWLTIPVLVTIVACLAAASVLARTRFGMRTYAIGSNPAAALRSGISITQHQMKVYVVAGTLAGLAGILVVARFSDASPLAGANDELASIAAAVIGGASLTGGRGSILGTVIGALITGTLEIGLIIAGVPSFWQAVAVGIIIVVAVYGDQIRIKLTNK